MLDKIVVESVNDAYLAIGKRIIGQSDFVIAPRKELTLELINVNLMVRNPFDRLVKSSFRDLSLRYLTGEYLWYERGSNLLEEIAYYSKFWQKISDDGIVCNSAYGRRIYLENGRDTSQWEYVKAVLLKDQSSRRAVMTLCGPSDMKVDTKDFPCTLTLQFLIRENKLHLITNMRSNDLFLGFCYDAAIFTLWQEKMLLELKQHYPNLGMGYYFHNVGSMHIYEKDFQSVKNSVENPQKVNGSNGFLMPRMKTQEFMDLVMKAEKNLRQGKEISKIETTIEDEFSKWLLKALTGEADN